MRTRSFVDAQGIISQGYGTKKRTTGSNLSPLGVGNKGEVIFISLERKPHLKQPHIRLGLVLRAFTMELAFLGCTI